MMSRLSILVGLLAVECAVFVFFSIKAIGFVEQYSTESARHQALIIAESLSPAAAEALVAEDHKSFYSVTLSVCKHFRAERKEVIEEIRKELN